jgi:exosortase B
MSSAINLSAGKPPLLESPSKPELVLLVAGLVAMYAPTYVELNSSIWSQVGQGHGPIMLALALWLAWQRWSKLTSLPSAPQPVPAYIILTLGLCCYVVGRSQDVLMLDVGSQLLIIPGLILAYKGWAGLKLMWFPVFFIFFQIPLPGPVVDALTGPLKASVSYVAEAILYQAGYPVARSGVTLTIGQYQLLVADACAGLNSIFALEAIGVFYLSVVQHTERWRNITLAVLIVPIAFVSNVIRVMVLVLVTYYYGDAAGQGFVHDFSGILLFMVATALTIGTDSLIGFLSKKFRPKQA